MRKTANFLDAFMEWTQYVETAEKYLRWGAISIISGALERKCWITHPGSNLIFYPNQYIFLVGNSGVARKSTAATIAQELLSHVPGICFLPERITAASLFDELQYIGAKKTYKYKEKIFPHSAGFLYGSEAAQSFHQDENSAITILTDLYDCGKLKGWSTTIGNEEATRVGGRKRIYNPCINMLMCTTKSWLRTKIVKEDIKGGFTGRILFVTHEGPAERIVTWANKDMVTPEDYEQRHEELIHDLTEISNLTGPFKMTSDFGAAYDHTAADLRDFIIKNPDHLLDGYYGRKLSHLLKLSMVASVAESNSMVINVKHFRQAQDWLDEIEPAMLKAFLDNRSILPMPPEDQIQEVIGFLRNKRAVTRQDLLKYLIRVVGFKSAPTMIRTLEELSVIKPQRLGTTEPSYAVLNTKL